MTTALIVIGIIIAGMAITYALAAPLKTYLDRESRRLQHDKPPTSEEPAIPAAPESEDGLTTEMADEWIRECRIDDV